MTKFKDYFAPTLVLMIICLCVTIALAVTYNITTPIIEASAAAEASASRAEVLPSGKDGFTAFDVNYTEGIQDVYAADNNSGYAITSYNKGFGGKVYTMVGIDNKGEITGIKVLSHSETPGLGTKAMTPEYLSQYISASKITLTNEPDATNIDTITGATISSKAIYGAINNALVQYDELRGVKND
ncbi:RnfABCDGE type electron transport complex subunit G [Anaerovorax odorimutans]|uniref:RnfABCDGE type electron transport complex subunit G n=1 Tax=Anaerovorax odorimutans TaxID=109327 RepID=UPI00041E51AD|nr:RnfABCDGE type electron transport complex subunit G [Anaerovorax odorimutans]